MLTEAWQEELPQALSSGMDLGLLSRRTSGVEAHRPVCLLRLIFNRMTAPFQPATPDQGHKPRLGLAVCKGCEEDLAKF